MKKTILISCFFLFTRISLAQTFAPIGATWYYDHTYFSGNNTEDYTKIQSIGDTMIQGKQCSIVNILNAYQHASGFPDSVYLYYDSGKVYRYFDDFDVWGLQYDFTANVGDTIVVYGDVYNVVLDSFSVTVDSIGPIDINSNTLKVFKYSESSLYWEDGQNVIEGIGGTSFLFPTYTLAENTNMGLRCYSDSVIGYYNTGLFQSCDTILTSVKNVFNIVEYSISPTLFQDEVVVKNNNNKKLAVQICDERLSIIGEYKVSANTSIVINLTSIPSGLYFAILNDGISNQVFKVIKL